MRYLLDTNAVIAIMGQTSQALLKRVYEAEEHDIGLSAVVMYELLYGACKSARLAYNLDNLERAVREFSHIVFDRDDAKAAGEIRHTLEVKGTPIGPYDILIAGQARARDLILVTNNTREFSRVPGLQIDDWTAATQ